MHYVYILRSVNFRNQIYIGVTVNLKKRLSDHNCGNSAHTSKYKPWELNSYHAFSNENTAIAFEKYLKTHSGRAFLSKRLVSNNIRP